MARNGSGAYSLPAGNPVVTGTAISGTVHNNTLADIAAALTASIANDGQTPAVANLPMGGNKHTNVAAAVAATDYARFDQVVATTGGTMTGNLTFSGPGLRLLADFSNATVTSRAGLQSSVVNGDTVMPIFPNGTSRVSVITFESSAGNPENSSVGVVRMTGGTEVLVQSTQRGSGSVLPLVLLAQNARLELSPTSGSITSGTGLPVVGSRDLAVVNNDAGVSSGARVVAQSNAGSLTMTSVSTAGGAQARIESTHAQGLALSSQTRQAFVVGGVDRFQIRSDGSLWTNSNGQPAFLCRAWVNFDGTSTVAIRNNGNVSSITDLGVGQYRVNFATAMPDSNYSVAMAVRILGVTNNAAVVIQDTGDYTTTHFDIKTHGSTNLASLDASLVTVQVFR